MVTIGTYHRYSPLDGKLNRPDDLQWLNAEELQELTHWHHQERRQAWLDGRWVSKILICECLGDSGEIAGFEEIGICSLNERGRAVRPQIHLRGRAKTWALSITHTSRGVLVAFSREPGRCLGVDLCPQQSLSQHFIQTWFTPDEQDQLGAAPPRDACRVWAAKESIYKAFNRGESFAPRCIEVFWNNDAPTCRYNNYRFGDELQLESWAVDNQVAVSAEIAGSQAPDQPES